MCDKCKKQQKIFDDFAATRGGEKGTEFLLALDNDDLAVLHDALHEQMAGLVIDRMMQGTSQVLQRAGALIQMHTLVKRIETERDQGYAYTDSQHQAAKDQARRFLSQILGLPEDNIEVVAVDDDEHLPPGYKPGQNIKLYRGDDPGAREAFERDRDFARAGEAQEKEVAITPENIARVIEKIIRDSSVPSKDIPLA